MGLNVWANSCWFRYSEWLDLFRMRRPPLCRRHHNKKKCARIFEYGKYGAHMTMLWTMTNYVWQMSKLYARLWISSLSETMNLFYAHLKFIVHFFSSVWYTRRASIDRTIRHEISYQGMRDHWCAPIYFVFILFIRALTHSQAPRMKNSACY